MSAFRMVIVALAASLAPSLVVPALCPAEEVVVASDQAEVKVWEDVVATVHKGERFEVLDRRAGWIAIAVETERGQQRGWVWANHLRTTVPEDSDAPPAPTVVAAGIHVEPQMIQVGFQQQTGYLTLRLRITNSGDYPIDYQADDFQLRLGQLTIDPDDDKSRRQNYYYNRIFLGMRQSGYVQYAYPTALPFLQSGTLAPGEKLEKWIRFTLPADQKDTDYAITPCRLLGQLQQADFEIDLRKAALSSLAATPQPSSLDPSVTVWEVYGPLNALNLVAFEQYLGKENDTRDTGDFQLETIVASMREPFFIDAYCMEKLGSTSARGKTVTPASIVFMLPERKQEQRPGQPSSSPFPHSNSTSVGRLTWAASIDEATIKVLAERDDFQGNLFPWLEHHDATVRTAATSGLSHHGTHPAAQQQLLKMADDEHHSVRIAAAHALVGADWSNRRPPYPSQRRTPAIEVEPSDALVDTLISLIRDREAQVRREAAQVASRVDDPRIVDALIAQLDDQESNVVASVCGSLAKLQATSAIDELQTLRKNADRQVRSYAIRTLGSLDALTPLETAIAQVVEGVPDSTSMQTIEDALDPDTVEPLIEYVNRPQGSSHYVERAAKILGMLGDQRATDALIQQLQFGSNHSAVIPEALGKLGNKQAIEPLEQASRASNVSRSRYGAILGALLRLGADGSLQRIEGYLNNPDPRKLSEREAIKALGQGRSTKATQLIVDYLDSDAYRHDAAQALLEQGTPAALQAIRERLLAADYEHGSSLISAMMSRRTPDSVALVHAAFQSKHPTTQQTARNYLQSSLNSFTSAGNLRMQGRVEDAIRQVENSLRYFPGYLPAQVLLAHLYHEADRQAEATKAYQDAVAIVEKTDAKDRTAGQWGYLGQSLYRLEKYEQARDALQQSIDQRKDDKPTLANGFRWWFLTLTLHQLDEKAKAEQYFKQLDALMPPQPSRPLVQLRNEAATMMGVEPIKMPAVQP